MGCATGVVKYLLFIFNLVFALSGLALVVVGALIWKDLRSYNAAADFLGTEVTGPPIALIVVGGVVFIIAFFGCCGAVRESHCMIVTFAVLLLTVLLAEVALGVVAFLNKDKLETGAEATMRSTLDKYPTDIAARQTFDALQTDLQCCGVKGPADYGRVFGNTSVPASCCVVNTNGEMCTQFQGHKAVHQRGCFPALRDFVSQAAVILGSVAIGIAFIEIVGIIFALCLANSIKNEARRMGV